MKRFIIKLILGKPSVDKMPAPPAFEKRVHNIKAIWHNEQHNDIGIEKILRLVLAISQFLFPGTYIKQIFGRFGIAYQDLSVDVFVLVKIAFPIILLKYGYFENPIFYCVLIWFMLETLFYVPTLIFASDIFVRPRSYRRSMLLLFLNYLEIVFDFAVIYSKGNYLNKPFEHWFDPVYFSMITSATIGFGDFYPVTPIGKLLVFSQSVVFLIFVVLFMNFFATKVEHKGYFDHQGREEE